MQADDAWSRRAHGLGHDGGGFEGDVDRTRDQGWLVCDDPGGGEGGSNPDDVVRFTGEEINPGEAVYLKIDKAGDRQASPGGGQADPFDHPSRDLNITRDQVGTNDGGANSQPHNGFAVTN